MNLKLATLCGSIFRTFKLLNALSSRFITKYVKPYKLHYKSHISIVMTFLVRECYGSPKKHEFNEFYRSTGEHSVNIRVEECFDKVLYHVNSRILKCKMTNVITMHIRCLHFVVTNDICGTSHLPCV